MKMISGSVFMVRADVMRQHGWGTSITEDWELTLRLYLSGYKVLYTPFIQAPSECVATFKQLARQRMRWAEGHTFNVKKYFTQILSSPNLSFPEKLEFVYFAPYYLQSIFFILGTTAWLLSEVVFRYRLPMLPATLGWTLVFTNSLSLVLMNLTGLFMERGVRRNWSGLFSFILLTFMLVPYQAYAALKGLIEPHEGGWHRTQKTGVITDIVDKLGLGKRMRRLLPKQKKSKDGGFDLGRRLGIPAAQIAARLPEPIRRRARGLSMGVRVASGLAALLVLLAILAGGISVVSAAPDAFYLHTPPMNDGESMNTTTGSGTASLVFDTPGQTARWYSSLSYPGGGGDSTLDAGAYTMNLYFDALPGGGWWDPSYAFRQQLTISTGSFGVSTGHEVAVTV
ncbi:MAG: glycosyltransferase, partial [Anaerolineales bacterium]